MLLNLQTTDDIRDMVHRTVEALAAGRLVGFPTETVYVVGAQSLHASSVLRLAEIADSFEIPLTLSLRSREAADDFLWGTSPLTRRLTKRCWPGPMTLFAACDRSDSAVSRLPTACVDRLCDGDGRMGFRVVDQRVLAQVHRYLAAPLVLAAMDSCHPSKTPGVDDRGLVPTTAEALDRHFDGDVPLLLDDGPTRYGGCSTVVRVDGRRWRMIREGVIEKAAMNQFVKPTIAVVCTGNTCRSPMAEVLLRDKLSQMDGRGDKIEVVSAGVAAGNGSPASPQAIDVMKAKGLDLENHSSRMLDDHLVASADLILTMTRGHRAAILAAWPDLHDRVHTLRRDGGDVTDPVGMPIEVYQQCAEQIDQELSAWLQHLGDDFFTVDETED